MNFRFLSPALEELAEAAEYYDREVSGLGADFLVEVDRAIDLILGFPEAWGKISEDFRHCNLRRFPYTVIYTLEGGSEIMIVSVFHQSREPSSWRANI